MATPFWGNTTAQNARIILSRWPVLQVTGVQTCPNGVWPRQWTSLPAGYFEPEVPPLSVYNSITAGERRGRPGGHRRRRVHQLGVRPERVGDPGQLHQRLAPLLPHLRRHRRSHHPARERLHRLGDHRLLRRTPGPPGAIKDSGQQEAVHVTSASVTAGPGNLTLSAATNYPHPAGTIVTTIPAASSRPASTSPPPKPSPAARRPRRSTRSAGRRSPQAAGRGSSSKRASF